MKKKIPCILGSIMMLVVGYVLGAYIGLPSVEKESTAGDVNSYNQYQQILLQPEYMSFNAQMKDNEEAQDRTIESLQIIENRVKVFASLTQFIEQTAANNAGLSKVVDNMKNVSANGTKVLPQIQSALKAAQDIKAGNKVDSKKALKNAISAFSAIESQLAAGKEFVDAVDAMIAKDSNTDVTLATARDLLVGHCAVNAILAQNDEAIDYWYNTQELLPQSAMAGNPVTE